MSETTCDTRKKKKKPNMKNDTIKSFKIANITREKNFYITAKTLKPNYFYVSQKITLQV